MIGNETQTGTEIGVMFWPALLCLCLFHVVPFYSQIGGTWFYPLIWWTFILVLELWHYRRGRSVFIGRGTSFPRVACFSAVLWFVFEAYNLYLGNWYYVGVPESRTLRWFGTTISFATVLPGMWVVQRAIFDGLPRSLSERVDMPVFKGLPQFLLCIGLVFSVGPFLFPDRMFPFVWGGLLLVSDVIAYRTNKRSFIGQLAEGDYRPCLSWLLAGVVCGFLWEFWNALAGAGWIYTVPSMGEWRLFEMPLIGYLGFPPFAMMSWRVFTLWEDTMSGSALPISVLTGVSSVVFVVMTLWAMDHYTYVSTQVDVLDFEGWTDKQQSLLNERDIHSLSHVRVIFSERPTYKKIELLRFADMGTELANCLWQADIRSVSQIEEKPTGELAEVLRRCRGGPFRFWKRRVKDWKQRLD